MLIVKLNVMFHSFANCQTPVSIDRLWLTAKACCANDQQLLQQNQAKGWSKPVWYCLCVCLFIYLFFSEIITSCCKTTTTRPINLLVNSENIEKLLTELVQINNKNQFLNTVNTLTVYRMKTAVWVLVNLWFHLFHFTFSHLYAIPLSIIEQEISI